MLPEDGLHKRAHMASRCSKEEIRDEEDDDFKTSSARTLLDMKLGKKAKEETSPV